MLKRMFKFFSASVKVSLALIIGLVLVMCVSVISYLAPQAHKMFLMKYVGANVVLLTDKDPIKNPYNFGGGTGFYVSAPSGQVYILTNRHVCQAAKNKDIFVSSKGSPALKAKVLELSDRSDLCLVQPPVQTSSSLKIGEEPSIGQHIAAIGHPNLQPKTFTEGNVVGLEEFIIPVGIIGRNGLKESDCKTKDSFIESYSDPLSAIKEIMKSSDSRLDIIFNGAINQNKNQSIKIRVCYVRNISLVTTVMAYHGSSGSPIVDFYGNVVGVVYAINNDRVWARGVPLSDVKAFLSNK